MAKKEISNSRKGLFYVGMVCIAVGLIMFLSTFVRVLMGSDDFLSGNSSMMTMMGPGFIGFVLIVIGNILRTLGVRGAAGSGMVLDPKQAREDLKPWTQMAGGMVKDAIGEVKDDTDRSSAIKIRCTHCRALNDEDASFCKACGETI